jgi:hypothetical protein
MKDGIRTEISIDLESRNEGQAERQKQVRSKEDPVLAHSARGASANEVPSSFFPQTAFPAELCLKVWRRDFSRGVAGRISVSSRNKNPTHNNPYRKHEDDVEGYRPCADVAGVPGHCPEQNPEETAYPD